MLQQAGHARPAGGRRDKFVAPDQRTAPQSLNSQNGRLPWPAANPSFIDLHFSTQRGDLNSYGNGHERYTFSS